jgi:hypothetical protein
VRLVSRCKACGSEYRKGVRVSLLTPQGLAGALVCQSCASKGVVIVAPTLAPVVKNAVARTDGVERVQNAADTHKGGGTEAAFYTGRAEGYEGAIEAIKREC